MFAGDAPVELWPDDSDGGEPRAVTAGEQDHSEPYGSFAGSEVPPPADTGRPPS